MVKRCLGCMQTYDDYDKVCPHCGYIEGTAPENAMHLMPGIVLNNRFLVGKVVGYGGFGVTYLGWDKVLAQKVAIKEYLPSEFSTRAPGNTFVTIFDGDKKEQFNSGNMSMRDFLSVFQEDLPFIPLYFNRGALAVNRVVSGSFDPAVGNIYNGIEFWKFS